MMTRKMAPLFCVIGPLIILARTVSADESQVAVIELTGSNRTFNFPYGNLNELYECLGEPHADRCIMVFTDNSLSEVEHHPNASSSYSRDIFYCDLVLNRSSCIRVKTGTTIEFPETFFLSCNATNVTILWTEVNATLYNFLNETSCTDSTTVDANFPTTLSTPTNVSVSTNDTTDEQTFSSSPTTAPANVSLTRESSGDDDTIILAASVGAGVLIILALLCLVVAILLCRRKRRKHQNTNSRPRPDVIPTIGAGENSSTGVAESERPANSEDKMISSIKNRVSERVRGSGDDSNECSIPYRSSSVVTSDIRARGSSVVPNSYVINAGIAQPPCSKDQSTHADIAHEKEETCIDTKKTTASEHVPQTNIYFTIDKEHEYSTCAGSPSTTTTDNRSNGELPVYGASDTLNSGSACNIDTVGSSIYAVIPDKARENRDSARVKINPDSSVTYTHADKSRLGLLGGSYESINFKGSYETIGGVEDLFLAGATGLGGSKKTRYEPQPLGALYEEIDDVRFHYKRNPSKPLVYQQVNKQHTSQVDSEDDSSDQYYDKLGNSRKVRDSGMAIYGMGSQSRRLARDGEKVDEYNRLASGERVNSSFLDTYGPASASDRNQPIGVDLDTKESETGIDGDHEGVERMSDGNREEFDRRVPDPNTSLDLQGITDENRATLISTDIPTKTSLHVEAEDGADSRGYVINEDNDVNEVEGQNKPFENATNLSDAGDQDLKESNIYFELERDLQEKYV